MQNSIKVLIAEDFPILLEDLTETIDSQSDMSVVGTADNGKEIVSVASRVDHDIILMDIEMENIIAGIQATESIRDMDQEEKIIFLTVHETKEMILTAMGTGAVDYIVKDTSDEEICRHIRSAYAGRPLMEEKIQDLVLHEFKRLQQSERSLLFFIHHLSNLTKAERELIRFLLNDRKVKEIAKIRGVEVVTIKSQINGLLKKLEVSRTKEITKTIRKLQLNHLFE